MELPPFLFEQATTIHVPAMLHEQLVAKAGQALATLNFANVIQSQTNWCWAAVSCAVSHFFNSGSTWTQCAIASAQTGQSCCANPVPVLCNVYGSLSQALQTTGNYVGMAPAPSSAAYVTGQINAGLPVCIRVAWNGGGAHFLTLYGLNGGVVNIADPWFGTSTATFSSFPSSYHGGAAWTHTFVTKS